MRVTKKLTVTIWCVKSDERNKIAEIISDVVDKYLKEHNIPLMYMSDWETDRTESLIWR